MKNIYIVLLSLFGLVLVGGIIAIIVLRPRSSHSSSSSPVSPTSQPADISAIIKNGTVFQPNTSQYKIQSSKGYADADGTLITNNDTDGSPFTITKSGTESGFTISTKDGYLGFDQSLDDDNAPPTLRLSNTTQPIWNIVTYKDKVLLSSALNGQTWFLKPEPQGDVTHYIGVKSGTPIKDNFLFVMQPV
jgi:hypothetical protein